MQKYILTVHRQKTVQRTGANAELNDTYVKVHNRYPPFAKRNGAVLSQASRYTIIRPETQINRYKTAIIGNTTVPPFHTPVLHYVSRETFKYTVKSVFNAKDNVGRSVDQSVSRLISQQAAYSVGRHLINQLVGYLISRSVN